MPENSRSGGKSDVALLQIDCRHQDWRDQPFWRMSQMTAPAGASRPLVEAAGIPPLRKPGGSIVVGLLEGEGVGPQLIAICRELLGAVADRFGHSLDLHTGSAIGLEALRQDGSVLPDQVCSFCTDVFQSGGAILAGPGGGRFVYEMRRRFDLFVKLNPLVRYPETEADGPVRWRSESPIDIMVVRENIGGLYQGAAQVAEEETGRRVEHRFCYSEREVMRVAAAAARIAAARSGRLAVVAKDSGLPELTRLWFDCARAAAAEQGVALRTLDVDFAVYAFIAAPSDFDVVLTPNCFGDIIADLGGLICGSRGLTFGASYSGEGAAVYQTNHGSAYDLVGTDKANPVGQILSVAMMLEESFGLAAEAGAIVAAVRQTWRGGWRTPDLMSPGRRLVGTDEFGRLVLDNLRDLGKTAAA